MAVSVAGAAEEGAGRGREGASGTRCSERAVLYFAESVGYAGVWVCQDIYISACANCTSIRN